MGQKPLDVVTFSLIEKESSMNYSLLLVLCGPIPYKEVHVLSESQDPIHA